MFCRLSRETALKSPPQLQLHYNPAAGIEVPFRDFDQAIDTLYFPSKDSNASNARGTFLVDNLDLVGKIRHMTFELKSAFMPGTSGWGFSLYEVARLLQTLSVVIADSQRTAHNVNGRFTPPTRRCRLVDIADDVADSIIMTGSKYHKRVSSWKNKEDPQSLRSYIKSRHTNTRPNF